MYKKRPAPKMIFSFLGAPGCGKGTLSRVCERRLEFNVLSTGNLCRKHILLGTEAGILINTYLKESGFIPDELISDMVFDWLESKKEEGDRIILDGYPRTPAQVGLFDKFLKNLNIDYVFRIIRFIITDDKALARLAKRLVCENVNCQAIYISSASSEIEGLCKSCGGKLSRRLDDCIEKIKERLDKYSKHHLALWRFFESQKFIVSDLDVTDKSEEEVFYAFQSFL